MSHIEPLTLFRNMLYRLALPSVPGAGGSPAFFLNRIGFASREEEVVKSKS